MLLHFVSMKSRQAVQCYEDKNYLNFKDLFEPACLARAVSPLDFGVVMLLAHETGEYKDQPSDSALKARWSKQIL